jgi:hypothetical protein
MINPITTERPNSFPKGFYVYGHYLPSGELKYVGKGQKYRAWDFTHRSKVWKNYAKKHGFYVKLLAEDVPEAEAFELETFVIDFFGRQDKKTGSLINLTDGGDGASGAVRTEETKEKIRQAKIAYHPLRGKKLPKEWAEKCRLGSIGKNISLESRVKISLANTGKKRTKEQKDALSKSCTGKGIGGANKNAKPIVDLDTGMIFGASTLAIEYVKNVHNVSFTKASLYEAMKKGKRCKGFLFDYLDKK